MKTFITLILVVIMISFSNESLAQKKEPKEKGKEAKALAPGKEKEKKAKADSVAGEVEEVKADKVKNDQQKDTVTRGNAYGKNKGELKGRDFGKVRSAEARAKLKTKIEEMDKEIAVKEKSAEENRKKVADAEAKLEQQKKAKKINDKTYREKMAQVAEAKKRVTRLDSINTVKRQEVEAMKVELEKPEPTGDQQE